MLMLFPVGKASLFITASMMQTVQKQNFKVIKVSIY